MADLLVEVRCEELPARRVREAAAALRDGLAAALEGAGLLPAGSAAAQPLLGTPRRLAAFLPRVSERQPDLRERLWGPPVTAALDREGRPTKAGEGFARNAGVPFADLQRGEKVPGKPPYLYADRVVPGRSAAEVVAEALPAVLASLPFKRTMRWPQSREPFARPVRGLLVLLGSAVVPLRILGVEAGRTTRGHAFLAPREVPLPSADLAAYRDALCEARVVVDWDERVALVKEEVIARWRECGADPSAEPDAGLLEEVTGLVEWPHALTGEFDPAYRALPQAVLVTAMAHHLRFFPAVRPGNERVLRARLYDADFFHRNDRRRPLEAFRPALAGTDFHRGLGTLLDKSERVRAAAVSLSHTVGLSAADAALADRAAFLLKCDLATDVVKEFTELQGVVGADYARADGEAEGVALALEAQYLPAGERLLALAARSPVAAVVSLADRADTLVSFFHLGEEPTGSADPFGLRRAALALLQVLLSTRWPLSPEAVVEPAAAARGMDGAARARLRAFLWNRVEQRARDDGFGDFIETAGERPGSALHEYWERLWALQALSRDPRWRDLVALVERSGNMAEPSQAPLPADLPAEARALAEALDAARPALAGIRDPQAFAAAYLAALGGPVEAMFDRVLVDDPARPDRRAAIRGLLHGVFTLFADRLGDLRRLGSGAKPPRA
ncbi:MAG: glycine--tRNA ligase subunit beta [Planctomycetes bacterium]|nr:glycine--tRNA ligase subunit beta [Planctomycetota bacterium]